MLSSVPKLVEWLKDCMRRNLEIGNGKPEATNLVRATIFDSHDVSLFFDHFGKVLDTYNFEGPGIWDMDETAVTMSKVLENYCMKRHEIDWHSDFSYSKSHSSILRFSSK